MARKKQHPEEHDNHERWLVSYADFITLLFAFFVVMYSISSVNEGKYRVLSDSLVTAFKEIPQSLNVVNVGRQATSTVPGGTKVIRKVMDRAEADRREAKRRKMKEIMDKMGEALGPLVQLGLVTINHSDKGIMVEINANTLFGTGDATLSREAIKTLTALGLVLVNTDNPIQVEGHTDSVPIRTLQFPSNWELSAARAGSVVRLLADTGVKPSRLTAVGYADNRPVADNETPEGRARNRRIAIFIGADSGRYGTDTTVESTAPAGSPAAQ
jgi:chemotaxis protein MotB